jgi:molecular chaperone GrpE
MASDTFSDQDQPAEPEGGDATSTPEAQLAELTDKWLRARTELENVRRAARQDMDAARRFGAAPAFTSLLAVLDNLQRALAAPPPAVPADFLQGLQFIEQQFVAVLGEHGVSRILPEPGAPFDPRLHQAVQEEASPDLPPGSVARVLMPGYRLHDRLLRPAQVIVARRPES